MALCKSEAQAERIQERALRFVLNDNCASYEQLLTESLISSLHLRRVRASAVEVYKCLNGITPAWRMEESLFRYYGAHVSNNVPSHMKGSPTLKSFQELIRSWSGPSCSCVWCNAPPPPPLQFSKCTLKSFMRWIIPICIYPLFRVEK